MAGLSLLLLLGSIGTMLPSARAATPNLVPYSEEFDKWGARYGISVTPNVDLAPDGNRTADRVDDNPSRKNASIYADVRTAVSGAHVFSCYLRAGSLGQAAVTLWDLDGNKGLISSTMTLSGSWQRLSLTASAIPAGRRVRIYLYPGKFAAENGSIFAWGAQFESGSTPGPYQKTPATVQTPTTPTTPTTTTPADSTAPAAPTGLVANWTGAAVQLQWSGNKETDLAGYTVERSGGSTTSFSQYASCSQPPYSDAAVQAGTTYAYRVRAVDSTGNVSAPSSIATVAVPAATSGTGTSFYVAPNGSATGDGSLSKPWDLATAFKGPSTVKPGDTIWLRGGTYIGRFDCQLSGTATAPIIVRQYPGEHAIIDKASSHWTSTTGSEYVVRVSNPWVWLWGFEIRNSDPNRSRYAPDGTIRAWRGDGVDVYAPNVKLINLVIHDNGHGIGMWQQSVADTTEVYGCLLYYNGNNKNEHAIYTHNQIGTKTIAENLIFDQGGFGLHAYADASTDWIQGYDIIGNVVFNNGAITLDDYAIRNILVGGNTPAARIRITDNCVYAPSTNATAKNTGIRLGYSQLGNGDVVLTNNFIAAKEPLWMHWWQSVLATGNAIYTQGNSVDLKVPSGVSSSAYQWDANTYISGKSTGTSFVNGTSTVGFPGWQVNTGLDGTSQVVQNSSLRPTGMQVFVRPNKYEAGRAHITVLNWDRNPSVNVDVSKVLPVGTAYEVRDAQNYLGTPVASGVYDGTPLTLPLNLTEIAPPVGNVEKQPVHTDPEFASFVLVPIR